MYYNTVMYKRLKYKKYEKSMRITFQKISSRFERYKTYHII